MPLCVCLQLSQNVKKVTPQLSKITLMLMDKSVIYFDKMPLTLAQKTKEYLEKVKHAKPSKKIIVGLRPACP